MAAAETHALVMVGRTLAGSPDGKPAAIAIRRGSEQELRDAADSHNADPDYRMTYEVRKV